MVNNTYERVSLPSTFQGGIFTIIPMTEQEFSVYVSEWATVVSLEDALYAKANGFSKPTYHYYTLIDLPYSKKGLKRVKAGRRRANHNKLKGHIICSAPQQDVFDKWKANRSLEQ